jgi:hypothetical protein
VRVFTGARLAPDVLILLTELKKQGLGEFVPLTKLGVAHCFFEKSFLSDQRITPEEGS